MEERPVLHVIEKLFNGDQHFEFHDEATFRLMDKLLWPYGFELMATRGSVGDKTIAVLKRVER